LPHDQARRVVIDLQPDTPLAGILHFFVAFDWGEEADLDRARQLAPAADLGLERRSRTPSSIAFKPPPLHFLLGQVPVQLPQDGKALATVDATLFDFGAVSCSVQVPFRLTPAQLTSLSAWLSEPAPLVANVCSVLTPLYERLKPAIQKPNWRRDFSEEYAVFQLPPDDQLNPERLLQQHTPWLGGLLLLEGRPLSTEEATDAVRLRVSYTPRDLFLADWAASVLVDEECEETLQVLEFTNLQLLEYRYIDSRLDEILSTTLRRGETLKRSILRPWRLLNRPLRELGELRMDANEVFERTVNVLKLVGDQYLARVYRVLEERFHLKGWAESIHRKLEVVEGVYKTLADQAATARSELLEFTIIVLILIEIVMAFMRSH
jgi:hypothetical protein